MLAVGGKKGARAGGSSPRSRTSAWPPHRLSRLPWGLAQNILIVCKTNQAVAEGESVALLPAQVGEACIDGDSIQPQLHPSPIC